MAVKNASNLEKKVSVEKNETTKINAVINIRPKTQTYQAFKYDGWDSVPDLIKFIGTQPSINPDLSLSIKKFHIKTGSFIIKSGDKIVKVVDNLNDYVQLVETKNI